jgi:methylmalonyl-CoA mutase
MPQKPPTPRSASRRLDLSAARAFVSAMSDTPIIPLAEDFAPGAREPWEALVTRTLKGGTFEGLRSRTVDGIVTEPLHAPAEAASAVRPAPAEDPTRPWDIRTILDHPDPAAANAQALGDLENGAASLRLVLDPSGETGVAVGSPGDLARVLDGVLLDLAPVALDAGFMGPQAAGWLAEIAKGGPAAPLRFNLDPLGAWARSGASPGPITGHLARAGETAAAQAETYPRARAFLASGRVVHEAGGGEAAELGFALASALAYARALTGAGLPPAEAFARITGGALGRCRILHDDGQAPRRTAALGQAHGRLRGARTRPHRRRAPPAGCWRGWTPGPTCSASPPRASAPPPGGADVVTLDPFTAPYHTGGTRPAPLARRQARNIQLVLMEEAAIGRVADPAGGSATSRPDRRPGPRRLGPPSSGSNGAGAWWRRWGPGSWPRPWPPPARARAAAYADDALGLLGVTRFPNAHDAPPARRRRWTPPRSRGPRPEIRLAGRDDVLPALKPIRGPNLSKGGTHERQGFRCEELGPAWRSSQGAAPRRTTWTPGGGVRAGRHPERPAHAHGLPSR